MTRSIPQSQFDMFAVNLDVGDVVLENGGDIDLGSRSVKTTSLVA